MLSHTEIKEMPARPWMPRSNKPELADWLSPNFTETDTSRLEVIGNIVVPQMGYLAANMLASMWKA